MRNVDLQLIVGLDPDSKKHVGKYSLGMRQRLGLAQALMEHPDILLLDEPTNHLDVDAKDELKKALIEYKGSILMVCHEPEFYDGLADEVWDCSKWTTRL